MGRLAYRVAFQIFALTLAASAASAVVCSDSAIQSAIDNALDGDTIRVDAGSCTWAGDVTMWDTKGLRLIGAGPSGTIVSLNGHSLNLTTSSARKPVRISGFRFNKTNGANAINISGTARNFRIDGNIFDENGVSGAYAIVFSSNNGNVTSYTYGLIDNNQFINRDYSTSIFIEWATPSDMVSSGDWIWSQPAQRGTAQAVYIENNVFSGNAPADASQVVDGRWGMKYVLRYNTIHNPWISTHSACTNGGRDPIWVEIYKNRFTDDANRYGGSQIEMRSVSGIIWGNTSAAPMRKYMITVDHERSWRSDCTGEYGGRCDGTRGFDGTTGLHGYVCLGQPGWGPPQASDVSESVFSGMFAWGNTDNGAEVPLRIANDLPYSSDHLVAGRDFFNAGEMTIGRIADRPAACTPGPSSRSVYVSTDENRQGAVIYVCTAQNTWTRHWEPYPYPHPLSRKPFPPANMEVVTQTTP